MINNIMFYSFIAFICSIILFFIFSFIYISYEKIFYGKVKVKDRINVMAKIINNGTKICTFLILSTLIIFILSLPFKLYYNYKGSCERNTKECKNIIKIINDQKINVYEFYVNLSNYRFREITKYLNDKNVIIKSFFAQDSHSHILLFTKNDLTNLTNNSIEIKKNFIIKPVLINKIENDEYLRKILYNNFEYNELLKFKKAIKNEEL